MAKGQIVAIRDIARNMADITTPTDKEIRYTVDGTGPYVFYMSIDGFTPEKARAMLQQRVEEWAKTVGKEVEVK